MSTPEFESVTPSKVAPGDAVLTFPVAATVEIARLGTAPAAICPTLAA